VGVSRVSKGWILAVLGLLALAAAYYLRAVFTPLLVALLLAYMLNPLVNAMERRRVPRAAGILAIYVVLLALLALLLAVGVPALLGEAAAFASEVTRPEAKIHQLVVKLGQYVQKQMGVENWEQLVSAVKQRLASRWGDVAKTAGDVAVAVLGFATSSIAGFIATLGFVALVPVYLFFLLMNLNSWWERTTHVIPRAYRTEILGTLDRIHRANASFFRGQMTIAAIEASIVFLVFWLGGMKLSLLFGLAYGVVCLIPYVGPFLWLLSALLFALIDTGAFGPVFWTVAGTFAGIQILEALVFQPVILGKETGLHPIAITLALMIFGQLLGFFGMLLAVPLASAAKILAEDYVWPMFADVADLTRVRMRPDAFPPGPPVPKPAAPPPEGGG
jgi:predicted PurR-regulated permease PerM